MSVSGMLREREAGLNWEGVWGCALCACHKGDDERLLGV